MVSKHPTITPAERRMLKNPYYHGFTVILNLMLKAPLMRIFIESAVLVFTLYS